jgi:ubiquinone biosynthesis protein Coq4
MEARWIPPAPNLNAGMVPGSHAANVELRLSQTNDLWPVITGFDTTVTGEIGLQAFHLTQFPYPLGAVLMAQALLSATIGAPERVGRP